MPTTYSTPKPSRAARTAAARATIDAERPAVAIRAAMATLNRTQRAGAARRGTLVEDLNGTRPGTPANARAREALRQHDAAAEQERADFVALVAAETESVGRSVLTAPPQILPENPLDALRINGAVADFALLDAEGAAREVEVAVQRGDLALVARLQPQLAALHRSREAFGNSPEVAHALSDMADALATPDVVRSAAAAEWVDAMARDTRFLVNALREGGGILDPIYDGIDVLPTLRPLGAPAAA